MKSCVFRGVSATRKRFQISNTNEVLGAYVTAGASLRLYNFLERVQEKALYCDTDAIIFVQKESEPALIECSNRLGDKQKE
jgi:hypothetical protein